MRKIAILLCVLLVVAFVFCACEKSTTVKVEYIALEGGTVLGGATQEKTVLEGESALFDEVTAYASEGYRFVSWSDGSTDMFRRDTLSESTTIYATFEKYETVTLSYSSDDGGYIEGASSQTLEKGSTGSAVTATPHEGYRFVSWSDGKTEPTRTDIASDNLSVNAIFTNKITVKYQATEGGYISGSAEQELAYGEYTNLVMALAGTGYRFVGWDDGIEKIGRSDMAGDKDIVYTAIFQKFHIISFSSADTSKGTIEGKIAQEVDDRAQSQEVKAVAKEGYKFVCWSNGSTDETITITATKAESLVAYFALEGNGLPVITIDTKNGVGITSKTTYVECQITFYDADGVYGYLFDKSAQIKGRGNSTWSKFDKKPYKIKFDEKQELFNYGKARDWVLLADYIDNSLLRNNLAYNVGGMFSELGSSPNAKSVEVYLNGEYRGVYLLSEQIEINKHRVPITDPTTDANTSFLVEMDGWADGTCVKVPDALNSDRKYSIKEPEPITQAQIAYIEQYLKDCISAVQGSDYERVKELIDVKSFAQAYIVFELFKNPDTNYSSVYMYKDVDGKLICGPVWDFDMSVGNVSHKGNGAFKDPALLWTAQQNPWFKGLVAFDEFKALVGEELVKNKTMVFDKIDEIMTYARAHADAYKANFEKWDVIGKNTWTNPSYITAIKTWEEHLEYVEDYLEKSYEALEVAYPPPVE